MLKAAAGKDTGPYGYAPCGQGFAATMKSLVKLGLATGTGGEKNAIRGIVLTDAGRKIATES